MTDWLGLAITMAAYAAAVAVSWGYSKKRFESIEEKLRDVTDRHNKYHELHFAHAAKIETHYQDNERHWTARQRDELAKTLERIEAKLERLLERNRNKDGE